MENKEIKGDYSLKHKICVSGAAETSHCGDEAFEKATTVGAEIIRQGAILVDGATTGFPFWAAEGAKKEGGIVIGLSPASSEKAHIKSYHLPVAYHDMIIYTGFDYSGRDLILVKSADAIIVGCGRIGTFNEFTIAFQEDKPIGILEGDWSTDDIIREIIEKAHRGKGKVVYSSDPKELVSKVIELIEKDKRDIE